MEHMGFAEGTGPATRNLLLARQTIDLLILLEEKTEGNLDDEESKLMAAILYELRTKWVDAKNS